jgi:hypothetical protein
VPLNFSVISNETLFNRDTVETCIHEVIQAMSRLLAARGTIQLEFCSVGRLFIRENKVKMRFFREFITTLDSSGEMETAFRPGTAQTEISIMSGPSFSRPETQMLVLPRIVETSGAGTSLSLEVSSVADPEEDTVSMRGDDTDRESTVSVRKITPLLATETKTAAAGCETSFDPPLAPPAGKCPTGEPESGRKQSPVVSRSGSSDSRRLVPKPAGLFVGENSMTVPGQLQSHLANLGHPSSSSSSPRPASASKSERAATRTEPLQTKNSKCLYKK